MQVTRMWIGALARFGDRTNPGTSGLLWALRGVAAGPRHLWLYHRPETLSLSCMDTTVGHLLATVNDDFTAVFRRLV
jgi:hypothetical protein